MAAVRELVTTLKTELDDTGFKQYEAGCQKIIALAKQITGVMSIAFSVEKVFEFAKGVVDSIQSIGKLRGQIMNLARPQDDVAAAMESTYAISQRLGVSYEGIVGTFRDFLKMSDASKISQDKLLAATENTQKALMVDKVSDDQKQQFYSLIERVEIMGKATPRMIGMLGHISKAALSLLKDHYKTDEDGLRKLAKAGKITADTMLEAFSHSNKTIEDRFAKLPWTIGRAWQYGYDKIVKLFTGVVTGGKKVSAFIGGAMKTAIDFVSGAMEKFAVAVGGVNNVMETLGIFLALVVGPFALAMLINMVSWTIRWAAASWSTVAPWLAAGAAIAGIAIAIQDLIYWVQGKPSLTATWVGPYKDIKKNFEELDIFASFRAIQAFFQGDFTKMWTEINKVTEGGVPMWAAIAASVVTIGGIFAVWKTLQFTGLLSAFASLLGALIGIEKQAKATSDAVTAATATGTGGTVVAPGTPAAPVKPPSNWPILLGGWGTLFRLPLLAAFASLWQRDKTTEMTPQQQANFDKDRAARYEKRRQELNLPVGTSEADIIKAGMSGKSFLDELKDYFFPPSPPPPPRPSETIAQREERIKREETEQQQIITPTVVAPTEPTPVVAPTVVAPTVIADTKAEAEQIIPPAVAAPIVPVIITPLAAPTPPPTIIIQPPETPKITVPGPQSMLNLPNIPPGAIGPALVPPVVNNADNKTFTFNNTNSVTVTVPDQAMVADEITRQVASQTQSIFDRAARDLGRSSPRMEGATG